MGAIQEVKSRVGEKWVLIGKLGNVIPEGYYNYHSAGEVDLSSYESDEGFVARVLTPETIITQYVGDFNPVEPKSFQAEQINSSPARGVMRWLPKKEPVGTLILANRVVKGMVIPDRIHIDSALLTGFGLGILSNSLPKGNVLRSAIGGAFVAAGLTRLNNRP